MGCLLMIIGFILIFTNSGCNTGGEAALFWFGMLLVLHHDDIEEKFKR